MDSLSLGTETAAFIDAVFNVAKDYLEDYYWVDAHPEQQESLVTFVCKAPYAHYADRARKALIELPLCYPVYFQLWTQGAVRDEDKERLIQQGRPYLDQPHRTLGANMLTTMDFERAVVNKFLAAQHPSIRGMLRLCDFIHLRDNCLFFVCSTDLAYNFVLGLRKLLRENAALFGITEIKIVTPGGKELWGQQHSFD
ncbi:MAG: hypothetical protein ACAF41_11915 [Leptolyngbya sp. BL-A-14]